MKSILVILMLMLSGIGWGQCACLYYDSNDNITCILYSNCGNPNLIACAGLTTSNNISVCSPGNPCPQTVGMNSGCGGCQSNGACWYNGNPCNPANVCDLLIEVISLPISLISYVGFVNELNQNELNWVTNSEHNNDYFIITCSNDGKNFRELYRLAGSGNSTQILSYKFIHVDPDPIINYYKLTQVDYDGVQKSYGPVAIDNRANKRTLLKTINMMGQEVNENCRGILINIYNDGTVEKIYKYL